MFYECVLIEAHGMSDFGVPKCCYLKVYLIKGNLINRILKVKVIW